MAVKGEIIFNEAHSKKLIWYSALITFGLTATILAVLIWIDSGGKDFWSNYLFVCGCLLIFIFVIYLPLMLLQAKWVFFKVTSLGIHLGGSPRTFMSEVFIPFHELLWLGPSPKTVRPVFGTYQFLNWTVKRQSLSPIPYPVIKSWTIVYKHGNENYALKFWPPEDFTKHLIEILKQKGLGDLLEYS